jgi:hypothetical protein
MNRTLSLLALAALLAGCDDKKSTFMPTGEDASPGHDATGRIIDDLPDASPGVDAVLVAFDASSSRADADSADSAQMSSPDARVFACDPVIQSGCGAGEVCTYTSPTTLACAPAAMPGLPLGSPCSPGTPTCAEKDACLQYPGQSTPTCQRICRRATDEGCASLTSTGTTTYTCMLSLDSIYGLCAPVPATCEPYHDTCPMGQGCIPVGTNATSCAPEGTGAVGDPCQASGCRRGSLCETVNGGDPKCVLSCDPRSPSNPCPGAQQSCMPSPGEMFGNCLSPPCNPAQDTCPPDQECAIVSIIGTDCVTPGPNTDGQLCGDGHGGGCVRGEICANISTGTTTGPLSCHKACDAAHGCGSNACPLTIPGFPFGACP